MTDNIDVKPSADSSAVSVATDVVDEVHYPVYKVAFGEDGSATLVDSDGLPVQLSVDDSVRQEAIKCTLDMILNELKIMNTHFAEWDHNHLTGDDLTEGDKA